MQKTNSVNSDDKFEDELIKKERHFIIEFMVFSIVMLIILSLQLLCNNFFVKRGDKEYAFHFICPNTNCGVMSWWCFNDDIKTTKDVYNRSGGILNMINPIYGLLVILC